MKLENPPPRPDLEKQKPMVIWYRNAGGNEGMVLIGFGFIMVLAFGIAMECLKSWIFWRMR